VENNPSYFKDCGDDCPVEQVSWAEAQKFIQKLIAKTGKRYRLPTEAEWEYACRGANSNGHGNFAIPKNDIRDARFPLPNPPPRGEGASESLREIHVNEYCGGDQADSVAWYGGYTNPAGNAGKSTHAVATLEANGFGLYDMSGNVWEWVEDGYHANYTNAPADGSAWTGETTRHVLRGGAWNSKPQEVRAANRGRVEPSGRGNVGFRVVRILP
jgi:formylglycine-generating enzyme required for sulfatase activity